jgi:predicted acylesterase/phospholipase RssA
MVHDLTEAADVEAVVRASSAIPAVNAPVAIDGRLHVDGAVYSATNSDVADHEHIDLVVIVAPMIPASGGSIASRLHRAQLRTELAPWLVAGRSALVIMPSEATHAERRDRERFTAAGIIAIEELVSAANRG